MSFNFGASSAGAGGGSFSFGSPAAAAKPATTAATSGFRYYSICEIMLFWLDLETMYYARHLKSIPYCSSFGAPAASSTTPASTTGFSFGGAAASATPAATPAATFGAPAAAKPGLNPVTL